MIANRICPDCGLARDAVVCDRCEIEIREKEKRLALLDATTENYQWHFCASCTPTVLAFLEGAMLPSAYNDAISKNVAKLIGELP